MNQHYPQVALRALHACEYCHAPEAVFNLAFEVEHIRPVSLGGSDEDGNLALACRSCNLHKATHIGAEDPESGLNVALFNPRLDSWSDHFGLEHSTGRMAGVTAIGRATIEQLNMNGDVQLLARRQWLRLGLLS